MQFRLLETLAAALLFCQFFSFADADAACEGNTIKVSDLCKCKVGFYSADGATSCTSCGAGYTTLGTGTVGSDASVCTVCAQGYYSNNGEATGTNEGCTPCGAGYSTPSDKTSGTGDSACTVCAAGYKGKSSDGTSGCVACVAGKYSDAGVSAESTTTCTSCDAGEYSADGATECTPCDDGYTTPGSGTSGLDAGACSICAAGFAGTPSNDIFGSTGCSVCDTGKYSAAGATTCTSCTEPGYTTPGIKTSGTDDSVCTVCAQGYYSNNGEATDTNDGCTKCSAEYSTPSDKTSGTGANACTVCAAGYAGTSIGGTSGCDDACVAGKYSAAGVSAGSTTTCDECSAGYTTPSDKTSGEDDSVCTVCAAGYAGTSSSGCVACVAGKYSAAGVSAGSTTTCTSCGAGYWTPDPGTPREDTNVCTVCAAGYAGTSSGGSSGCVACVAGKYSAAGDSAGSTTTCTSCTEPGYTTLSDKTSGTDASACNVCAQGYYSNNNGEATGTNLGCTKCSDGSSTPGPGTSGEDDSVCTVCAPGYGISGTGCAACPNLQYKDAHSKAYCSPCQPNRVGCGGDSKGYCDAGYEERDGSCISCAELNAYKKYPDSASYTGTCIKCQYRTDDCGGPNSGKCLAGFQVPVNGQGCEPCLQGYYKTRAGNYDCSKCSGSTLKCGSSSPGLCAKGQGMYEIDVGANMESYICKTCEKGKYNLQSNTPEECSTCSAGNPTCGGQDVGTCTEGYGTDDAGKTCTKCEPNHFKMITGNTPCTSCAQGYAGCSASNPGTRSYPLVPPTIGGGGIAGISIGTGVIVGVLVYAYLHIAHRGQMASLQTHHGKQIKEAEAEAEGLTP